MSNYLVSTFHNTNSYINILNKYLINEDTSEFSPRMPSPFWSFKCKITNDDDEEMILIVARASININIADCVELTKKMVSWYYYNVGQMINPNLKTKIIIKHLGHHVGHYTIKDNVICEIEYINEFFNAWRPTINTLVKNK